MDADDEISPNTLNVYNSAINEVSNDIVIMSSDFHKIHYNNNELHSISYILNDESMSSKIKRYHPNCDYLNNISYSCFGHGRCFKNLPDIKFEIDDRLAGAEDSYRIFWLNSYGKYLHIPRPLYKWNMHDKSISHSTNVKPNFNTNFDISLNKLNGSDFGVDNYYNDIYIETSAIGSYTFGELSGNSVSLWTRFLNDTQLKKLTNLYYDCNLSYNDISSDIHIICLNYFSENNIVSILNKISNKSILFYYQNQNKYFNPSELDTDMNVISDKYITMLNDSLGSIYWWKYIRHLVIKYNI
jgi:hypothetical protein